MPIAQFQLPDGSIAEFEVPEGVSDEEAQRTLLPEIEKLSKTQQTTPAEDNTSLYGAAKVGGDIPVNPPRLFPDPEVIAKGALPALASPISGIQEEVARQMATEGLPNIPFLTNNPLFRALENRSKGTAAESVQKFGQEAAKLTELKEKEPTLGALEFGANLGVTAMPGVGAAKWFIQGGKLLAQTGKAIIAGVTGGALQGKLAPTVGNEGETPEEAVARSVSESKSNAMSGGIVGGIAGGVPGVALGAKNAYDVFMPKLRSFMGNESASIQRVAQKLAEENPQALQEIMDSIDNYNDSPLSRLSPDYTPTATGVSGSTVASKLESEARQFQPEAFVQREQKIGEVVSGKLNQNVADIDPVSIQKEAQAARQAVTDLQEGIKNRIGTEQLSLEDTLANLDQQLKTNLRGLVLARKGATKDIQAKLDSIPDEDIPVQFPELLDSTVYSSESHKLFRDNIYTLMQLKDEAYTEAFGKIGGEAGLAKTLRVPVNDLKNIVNELTRGGKQLEVVDILKNTELFKRVAKSSEVPSDWGMSKGVVFNDTISADEVVTISKLLNEDINKLDAVLAKGGAGGVSQETLLAAKTRLQGVLDNAISSVREANPELYAKLSAPAKLAKATDAQLFKREIGTRPDTGNPIYSEVGTKDEYSVLKQGKATPETFIDSLVTGSKVDDVEINAYLKGFDTDPTIRQEADRLGITLPEYKTQAESAIDNWLLSEASRVSKGDAAKLQGFIDKYDYALKARPEVKAQLDTLVSGNTATKAEKEGVKKSLGQELDALKESYSNKATMAKENTLFKKNVAKKSSKEGVRNLEQEIQSLESAKSLIPDLPEAYTNSAAVKEIKAGSTKGERLLSFAKEKNAIESIQRQDIVDTINSAVKPSKSAGGKTTYELDLNALAKVDEGTIRLHGADSQYVKDLKALQELVDAEKQYSNIATRPGGGEKSIELAERSAALAGSLTAGTAAATNRISNTIIGRLNQTYGKALTKIVLDPTKSLPEVIKAAQKEMAKQNARSVFIKDSMPKVLALTPQAIAAIHNMVTAKPKMPELDPDVRLFAPNEEE